MKQYNYLVTRNVNMEEELAQLLEIPKDNIFIEVIENKKVFINIIFNENKSVSFCKYFIEYVTNLEKFKELKEALWEFNFCGIPIYRQDSTDDKNSYSNWEEII